MNEDHMKLKLEEAKRRRQLSADRLRRRVELGYIKGKIHTNGQVTIISSPKGIQNWYDTRTLVKLVTEAFDRNEKAGSGRICWINNKWQLQIRGKHLRRLLKAMPNVKQVGRKLVEEK